MVHELSSRVHRATSSSPNLDRVLEEFQRLPFISRISRVQVRYVNNFKFTPYNGLDDPKPFLTSKSFAISRAHFSDEEYEAGCCQLFVENLVQEALGWFSRLPPNSIGSYHELTTAFLQHHSTFMIRGASNADLWNMFQRNDESLRDFMERFKRIVSKLSIADDTAISAFRNAIAYGSRFRDDIIIYEPLTLDDALHRANKYIEVEKEKDARSNHPSR
ncbi:PREDICTED: uncharacterized protein LOC104699464 [Camelina sativa]|uniref:Uncharacterized protein LOC104699464 n=1 Tax=Camelina sativa TaxID=90675 RepID=A0ABM0SLN0_CAMSA|nr:PREDICTED: uncharacterized protein LOC104699464 [Camelina sativa]